MKPRTESMAPPRIIGMVVAVDATSVEATMALGRVSLAFAF